MLTIALHNALTARADVLTAELADIALRHHPAIAPLEELERWLSRRSQVLHLQKSLLGAADPDAAVSLTERYQTSLDALAREIRERYAELLDARMASQRPVHVASEDGQRMVPLDAAERARRLGDFDARLADEMAAHRRFCFGAPARHPSLLADLEQEWHAIEGMLDELKERMDALNLPAVEASTRVGRQFARLAAEKREAARDAAYHQGWLLACQRGDLAMIVAVLDALPAPQRPSFVDRLGLGGMAAWHLACENHDLPLATLLLRYGADPHRLTESERSPLSVAVRVDRGNRTRTFLDWLRLQGAVPGARDRNGRGALNEAAFHGNLSALRWLVEQGAPLQQQDCHLRTALHVAAAAGHAAAVGWLLRQGADPFAVNAAGERPIFEAARQGRAEAMQAFLDSGYWLNDEERRQLCETGMLTGAPVMRACREPLAALLAQMVPEPGPRQRGAAGARQMMGRSVLG